LLGVALDLGVKDRTSVYNSKSFIEIPSWRRLLIVYNKTELEPYERSELGSDSSDKITKPVIQRKLYIYKVAQTNFNLPFETF